MADEREKVASPAPEPEKDEPKYSVEDLRANPRLIGPGISPHAVAGALAGGRKQHYTADEAKAALKDFLKRKDTTDRGDAE